MTQEAMTKKFEPREGQMLGHISALPRTEKRRTVDHKNISGNCADCRKYLSGHWIKVYPDGKKEDYPYGYCRDPAGERGLCMVFRPREETPSRIPRLNVTFSQGYSSAVSESVRA